MIVPEYWSEFSETRKVDGRRKTLRRFGWSDESEERAKENAEHRVSEAFALLADGVKVSARDRKVAYNGSDGVPIREEIIARHEDTIITRNGYGALCLNTPDILFADVDIDLRPSLTFWLEIFAVLFGLAIAISFGFGLPIQLFYVAIICVVLASLMSKPVHGVIQKLSTSPEEKISSKIETFIAKHSSWHVRLYETPAGFRILVMNKVFTAQDDIVDEFFTAVSADPIYVRMCKHQHCFRARISPKPWRIGIGENLKPNPGIWPIKAERMADRIRWVKHYNERAKEYASCRFLKNIGSGKIDPKAEEVRRIHDDYCNAISEFPIA